jgi:hypothetical protein
MIKADVAGHPGKCTRSAQPPDRDEIPASGHSPSVPTGSRQRRWASRAAAYASWLTNSAVATADSSPRQRPQAMPPVSGLRLRPRSPDRARSPPSPRHCLALGAAHVPPISSSLALIAGTGHEGQAAQGGLGPGDRRLLRRQQGQGEMRRSTHCTQPTGLGSGAIPGAVRVGQGRSGSAGGAREGDERVRACMKTAAELPSVGGRI